MKMLRYEGKFDLLSPLCHSAPEKVTANKQVDKQVNNGDSTNNIIYLRRLPVEIDGKVSDWYGVSGAEIRSLMKMLVVEYTLGKLNISVDNLPDEVAILLYSGGRGESGITTEYKVKEKVRTEVPVIDLFGGTVNGTFFESSLRCDFAYVLSVETSRFYPSLAEQCGINEDTLVRMADFKTAVYSYGHARHRHPKIAHLDTKEEKIQMPYHIEAIPAGAKMLHGFTLVNPTEGSIACFEAALKMFLDYGYLGGRSAAGYGRFKANYFDSDGKSFVPQVKSYDEWLEKNGETMKETLLNLTKILKSKADDVAPVACAWLVENKEAVQRLIEDKSEDIDIKELYKVDFISDSTVKSIKKLVNTYGAVLKEAITFSDGKELYEKLDDAKRKSVGEFYNKSRAAASKKPSKPKNGNGRNGAE